MNSFNIKFIDCYKINYSLQNLSTEEDVKSFHTHQFYHYSFILSCEDAYIGINNTIFPMKKNTFYLFKPGEMHGFFPGQNATSIEIKFSVSNKELLKIVESFPSILEISDDSIHPLLEAILKEYNNSNFSDSMIFVKFYELLLLLNRITTNQDKHNLKLKDFVTLYNKSFQELVAYIHQNFSQDISLDQMAGIMNMEKNYFIKSFKKEFQCTPVHYLNIVRLHAARIFLEFSDDSVDEISLKVGCSSASSLSKLFKYHWGNTPTEYRKQIRDKIK